MTAVFMHLEYTAAYRHHFLRMLARSRANELFGDIRLLIVDNALKCAPIVADPFPSSECLSGDNRIREFSGWDAGLDHLRTLGVRPRVVVFSNDTICRHHWMPVWRFNRFLCDVSTRLSMNGPILHGEAESLLPFPLSAPWGNQMSWVATYLFAMSGSALERIPRCSLPPEFVEFVDPSVEHGSLFRDSSVYSLFQRVDAWLIRQRRSRRHNWYKAEPLTVGSMPALAGKARAVLSELYLTHLALTRGVAVSCSISLKSERDRLTELLCSASDRAIQRVQSFLE